MNISSKLRRLRKTKNLLLQHKREIQERTLPRLHIVASHAEGDRIKTKHKATCITTWQPLIVISKAPTTGDYK